ncbi:unannotated protein [freshwater metagenome]|uniref:Unannotated protein n=1 Tax=freshwater metagenome TaxID=449393 RepID=A0A6J7I787_9ZZZZ
MEAPVTVPTRPLARSRRSAGISRVTSVGSAIDRGLPAITPSISRTTSTHSGTLAAVRKDSSGASISTASDTA